MNRAADQPEPNPLREGLSARAVPQPCIDCDLRRDRRSHPSQTCPCACTISPPMATCRPPWQIVGFARRRKVTTNSGASSKKPRASFRGRPCAMKSGKTFAQSIFYHQSEFGDEVRLQSVSQRLDEIDKNRGTRGNRLFYFAACSRPVRTDSQAPESRRLKPDLQRKLGSRNRRKTVRHRSRLSARAQSRRPQFLHAKNKPTGSIISSARKPRRTSWCLRFANAIFAPLWNTHYIDHVQITAAETLGVENRAGYYERAGALRDMVQNHLLQLLCLVGNGTAHRPWR
mgnify:CR=1 FL=1